MRVTGLDLVYLLSSPYQKGLREVNEVQESQIIPKPSLFFDNDTLKLFINFLNFLVTRNKDGSTLDLIDSS